jgi:hypothetical protein
MHVCVRACLLCVHANVGTGMSAFASCVCVRSFVLIHLCVQVGMCVVCVFVYVLK